MRVSFERTGGFAGMRVTATIDSEALPPDEEHKLRHMVETTDFFQLPATLPAPAHGADRFVYRLTVESGGRRHTVEASDAAVPSSLRPLLEWLIAAARQGPGARTP